MTDRHTDKQKQWHFNQRTDSVKIMNYFVNNLATTLLSNTKLVVRLAVKTSYNLMSNFKIQWDKSNTRRYVLSNSTLDEATSWNIRTNEAKLFIFREIFLPCVWSIRLTTLKETTPAMMRTPATVTTPATGSRTVTVTAMKDCQGCYSMAGRFQRTTR